MNLRMQINLKNLMKSMKNTCRSVAISIKNHQNKAERIKIENSKLNQIEKSIQKC